MVFLATLVIAVSTLELELHTIYTPLSGRYSARIFPSQGSYSVNIEQAMRYGEEAKIESLKHILDIGLIVSEQYE